MDVISDTPTKSNNPLVNTTHFPYIESLEYVHQALTQDEPDALILENVVQGLLPQFPDVDALFVYQKVNGVVNRFTTCLEKTPFKKTPFKKTPNDFFLNNIEQLLTVESFEICNQYESLNISSTCNEQGFETLKQVMIQTSIKECLLIPISLHNEVNAVLVVMKSTEAYVLDGTIQGARALLTNLFLLLQRRSRVRLQAQLQTQLLGFQKIDKTLSQFAALLLSNEDAIFQIQILSLEEDYVYDFQVYGQMTAFEDYIKENALSKGKVHISFNKRLEEAVRTKSTIYTPDVYLDPEWLADANSKTRSIIYFPLLSYDDRVVGVFCAISTKINGFSPADKCFLEQTMGIVNLAFQSHNRILDLKENILQMGQLAEVSQKLQNTNSVQEAQAESLKIIIQETPASSCYFLEFNKDSSYFLVKARAKGSDIDIAVNQKVFPDRKLLEKHLSTDSNVPIHFSNGSTEIFESVRSVFAIDEAIKELIFCPLVQKDGVSIEMAFIVTEDKFSTSDIALAKTIMSSYGNCIRRIESAQVAKTEIESYKKLASFGSKIEELQNFDELIDYGTQELMAMFGVNDASYYGLSESNQVASNVKNWGIGMFDQESFSIKESTLLNLIMTTRKPLYIEDYANHPHRLERLVKKGLKSVLFLPIEYANNLIGYVALHAMTEKIHLIDSDLDLARQFLSRLRNALERSDYVSQLERSREDTLRSLGIVLEHRDFETQGHTDRVVNLSKNFAKQLQLSAEETNDLVLGAYLHDIGKLAIPDRILLKPGKLTDEEFDEIKTHSMRGYEMAKTIPLLSDASTLLVRHHHEQWQGTGYPDKLQGNDIPFLARMFTLVDVYDALRSYRPYKKAWTKSESIQELRDKQGIMFDPALVEDFIVVVNDYDDVYKKHNIQQESIELFKRKQNLMPE